MTETKKERRLVTVPTGAKTILAISERKLWSMLASGEIPAVRIGRSVRIELADLEAYIERQKARAVR